MARAKLKIGENCKGKYGPHFIGGETDLEIGQCKKCKRAACDVHRARAISNDPKYNTKMSQKYRKKRLVLEPDWEVRRARERKQKNPISVIANQMVTSLRRADRLMGRQTHPEITPDAVGNLLRESLGKPCVANISCGGATIKFVPKNELGSPSLDHVNPIQQITTLSNLKIICFDCNFSKSDLTLAQAKAVVAYVEKISGNGDRPCLSESLMLSAGA
jgi:hypothetical protein